MNTSSYSFRWFFALLVLLAITWAGCNNGEPDPMEEASLENLADTWVRVLSNNPVNDEMKVTVSGDQGRVTDDANSGFSVGDIKWSGIVPTGTNVFDYEELGSDGNYYPAVMTLDGDTIQINVNNSGAGNIQKWVRESEFTTPGPSAETITLTCDQITSETTFQNGAAAVDYIVPSGCVLNVTDKLTIEAGTVIAFEENAGLGVYDNGALFAVGTATEPIVLRGMQSVAGYWRGIHIETNTLNNQLDYVTVSDAGSNYVYCCNEVASVFLKSSGKLSIKNTTIENGAGIGLVAGVNNDLREYSNVTITTHESYPLSLHLERADQLDGMGSDYTGNDEDFVEISGDVDEETNIPQINVPYLTENGAIQDLTELVTVEAGVEIVFSENSGWGVFGNGALTVNGTASKVVIMRGKEASRGYWRGIYIDTNSNNNRLTSLRISDAGSNYVYCCDDIASLFFDAGKTALSDVVISNGAGYGIASKAAFEFSSFDNVRIRTHSEAPLYLTMTQMGQLDGRDSDFSGNDEDYLLIYDSDVEGAPVELLATNVPYRVLSGKVIDVKEPLSLAAGTVIEFEENAGLGVYDDGSLNAIGTANEGIIFRGSNDVSAFWRGIHSETNSNSNRFSYVTVSNAGSNYVYCCHDIAGLYLDAGIFTVENSTFTKNGGCGIFVRGNATLTESGNTFNENVDGTICQ